jgi:GNAT superfamily N-acetyltransferase
LSIASCSIKSGYRPGAIGRITELHAAYYHRHWGFGLYFEAKVASGMAEFLCRFDAAHDGFWLAVAEEGIVGSVAIDARHADRDGAHLRWFIVAPEFKGRGLGNRLLVTALDHCRQQRFGRVYLWTFAGLDAARHLYEKSGFTLCRAHDDNQWGVTVHEQMFELTT